MTRTPPRSTLFPNTTLFRSQQRDRRGIEDPGAQRHQEGTSSRHRESARVRPERPLQEDLRRRVRRSEEHTSELQSRFDLVCRLLLEKKKKTKKNNIKKKKTE